MQPFQEADAWDEADGSPLRADTNHFYNCLQQKRKHELSSSVVDGFEGESRMNCQQDGLCFYPGICCRPLRSGFPRVEPWDLCTFFAGGGSLCRAAWGWKRTWQVWLGGEGNPNSYKLPSAEEALNEGALTLVGT